MFCILFARMYKLIRLTLRETDSMVVCLLQVGEPLSLGQDRLRDFPAHVGVTGLLANEHSRHISIGLVHVAHCELDLALEDVKALVVLGEERF